MQRHSARIQRATHARGFPRIVWRGMLAFATICTLVACGSSTTAANGPVTLTVSPHEMSLWQGRGQQLTTTVFDAQGHVLSGAPIVYESSDSNVIAVMDDGYVYGAGPPGTGIVRARTSGLVDSAVVHIVDTALLVLPESVVVEPRDTTLHPGETFQLTVTVFDHHGHPIPDANVVFVASDSGVAGATRSGLVEAGTDIGHSVISATLGDLSGSLLVEVTHPGVEERVPLGGVAGGVAASVHEDVYVSEKFGALQRVDVPHHRMTYTLYVAGSPTTVVFDSSGTRAYASTGDDVSIVDVAKESVVATIPVLGTPGPLAVSADGSRLYVASEAGYLYAVDVAGEQIIDSLPMPAPVTFALLAPSDSLLYVATGTAGSVLEVHTGTLGVARTFSLGGGTEGLAFSPDGTHLYVANEALGRVDDVDLMNGSVATPLPLGGNAYDVALNGDGTDLYVTVPTGAAFPRVAVVNRAAWSVAKVINVGGAPSHITLDPVSGFLLVVNGDTWDAWIDFVR